MQTRDDANLPFSDMFQNIFRKCDKLDFDLTKDLTAYLLPFHEAALSQDENELFYRMGRIEFYLLTSLGTEKMRKLLPRWMPFDPASPVLELSSRTKIIMHTHLQKIDPILAKQREYLIKIKSSLEEVKNCFELTNEIDMALRTNPLLNIGIDSNIKSCYNTVQKYQLILNNLDSMLEKSDYLSTKKLLYVGECYCDDLLNHSHFPLVDTWLNEIGKSHNSVEDALKYLENEFGCLDKNIYEPVPLDGRSSWHQDTFLKGFEIMDNHNIYFRTPIHSPINAILTDSYERHGIFSKQDNALLYYWGKGKDRNLRQLPVTMYKHPFVLLNGSENSSTINLLPLWLPERIPMINNSHAIFSWVGGYDSLPYMDWNPLTKYRVNYFYVTWQPKAFELFAGVYHIFKKLKVNVDYYKVSVDYENNLTIEPVEDGLLKSAMDEQYAISLYEEGSQKQNNVSPRVSTLYDVISDTKVLQQEFMQSPFPIEQGSISMLYSVAGIGKTWFALSFAYAVAAGLPLCRQWQCVSPIQVLYIDGEMGSNGLKQRLKTIEAIYGTTLSNNKNFHCLSLNAHKLELSTHKCQEIIMDYLQNKLQLKQDEHLLIVIDNILSITQYDDYSHDWKSIVLWLKTLQASNATVLVIHHANKSGEQRGSGIKTIVVDNVIKISLSKKIKNRNTLNLHLEFEKNRYVTKELATSFDLSLNTVSRAPSWHDHGNYKGKKNKDLLDELLMEIIENKMQLRWEPIAEATGYQRAMIYRRYKTLLELDTKNPLGVNHCL